jgi:hypothetical protein
MITLKIDSEAANSLLTKGNASQLNDVNILDQNFIVGVVLVGGNHWNSLIINLKKKLFYCIDPMHQINTNLKVNI